jgi:hypothetical protein
MGLHKGYKQTPEHIAKRTARFKGISFAEKFGDKCKDVLAKMSQNRKGKLVGKDNPMFGEKGWNWKGDKAGYAAIHYWVKKNKPKPECCEECKKQIEELELANISGEYKRDINDFKYLCAKCHFEFDARWRFLKQYSNDNQAYLDKWLKVIMASKTDEEIKAHLDRIYSDGFTDGVNEGDSSEPDVPAWKEDMMSR